MLRNLESRFAEVPQIDIQRSIMDMSHGHLTSFNVGDLVPILRFRVMPGDSINLTTSIVARLQTLLTPIMSNAYIDTYFFYVPYRLCWNHFTAFMGENISGPWAPQTQYTPPKIKSPTNGWNKNTIADYLGVPPGVEFKSVADGGDDLLPLALDFRAVALVCQEWFRDENLTDPLNIPLGDSNQTGSNGSSYINDVANGGAPFRVAKYHDYFTSCLPDPQKNRNPVTFPLISGNLAPVHSLTSTHGIRTDSHAVMSGVHGSNDTWYRLAMHNTDGVIASLNNDYYSGTVGQQKQDFIPVNLWADLSTSVGAVTVNQLRLAFQMQKFYEKQALGGSRYREQIKMMYGVTVPDARVQIPEYLGGHRIPIQIHQIANTSQSSSADLGDLGAMSNTSDINDDFFKSFSEWGVVLGFACVRYDHVYSQGLHRDFTADDFFSWYLPVLANIGEQPVFKYELDATVRSNENRKAVFGYNEAWSSYRYVPSRTSGEMRPQVSGSLASWHLGDNYASMPSLSDGWIREDKTNVDRVLAVTSANANQVFADIWFNMQVTRPMPVFSVPGLIDHH